MTPCFYILFAKPFTKDGFKPFSTIHMGSTFSIYNSPFQHLPSYKAIMSSLCFLNKVDILEDVFPLFQKYTWQDYPSYYCQKLQENIRKYHHRSYSPYEQTFVHIEPLAIRAINLPFMTSTEVGNFQKNPYWPENPTKEHILSIRDPYIKWLYLTFRPGSLSNDDIHYKFDDD